MEIGGIDIVIPTNDAHAIDEALFAINKHWPECVYENANTGEYYNSMDEFTAVDELFVYQNKKMRESWDSIGLCEENWNKMIHLIHSHGELTFVADDPKQFDLVIERIKNAV